MKIKFTKMHGCGNDYIYVNGFEYSVPKDKKPDMVRKLSDRHFGIGSDGVIFINPSEIADFEMEMFNADGSRAEMCGNGIRCVAKYVYDNRMTNRENFVIESMGKKKYITLDAPDGEVKEVKVDMGEPILEPELIPVVCDEKTDRFVARKVQVDDRTFEMTCVSMGNPHTVMFCDPDLVLSYGPLIEFHKLFPKRVNAEFVKILDRKNVEMRVWERGTGETLCCGTGCCATAVACILNGLTEDEVTVHVLGGEVKINWDRETNHVFMTGPATTVFDGEVEIGE
jgi:diaminopimelate epimerase